MAAFHFHLLVLDLPYSWKVLCRIEQEVSTPISWAGIRMKLNDL
jgi:hypothetical protein